MKLQEFSARTTEALQKYYGKEAEVKQHTIYKNNGILLYGVCVLEKGKNIAPTVYLNDFFERCQQGESFGNVMKEVVRMMEKNRVEENINIDFFLKYEQVKKRLVIRLIHWEKNQELLQEIPHRKFMDLAVVCHCVVMSEEIGYGAILIHQHHLQAWGVSEEMLFEDAFENSPKIEPYSIMKMSDMVKEIMKDSVRAQIDKFAAGGEEEKEELLNVTLESMAREIEDKEIPMYVLTNSRRYYGAGCLAYPGMLKLISELLQGDFYVLPSSVHEIILMKKTEYIETFSLNQIIHEVNQTQVAKEEWLSDHAYLYQKDTEKFISVSNHS